MTQIPDNTTGLKKDALSYPEVIAQSISVIAPSTVPAAVLGLVYASAGNGTWLSFLLGMLGLVLVSYNINHFACRSASPGSIYTYIVKGLGPVSGVMSGWSLLLAYMLTGMSTLCGFAIFSQMLLDQVGIHLSISILLIIGVAAGAYIAYRDIQLSAKMMLVFEGGSILAVIALGILIWSHNGFAVDTKQFTLEHAAPGGIMAGIVLVIFGFSGFESSTSLGDEAKDPLKSIPRSIIHSTLFTGVFFLFMAYVVVLGFHGLGQNLAKTEAPLAVLSGKLGTGLLGELIGMGVVLSFFSCTLACINSTARLVFAMARHGLFHDALGQAHESNRTPYVAVALAALLTLLAPMAVLHSGVSAFAAQGYFGTLSSFGFLIVYILVSIAAPVYLRGLGKLRKIDIAVSVAAVLFMMLPLAGSVGIPGSKLFAVPDYPDNLIPWIFVGYMLIGFTWFYIQKMRSPHMVSTMENAIEAIHARFDEERESERLASESEDDLCTTSSDSAR